MEFNVGDGESTEGFKISPGIVHDITNIYENEGMYEFIVRMLTTNNNMTKSTFYQPMNYLEMS